MLRIILEAGLWWPMPLILAQGGRGSGSMWFKANLLYRVCSRTARATPRNSVSKKTNKNKSDLSGQWALPQENFCAKTEWAQTLLISEWEWGHSLPASTCSETHNHSTPLSRQRQSGRWHENSGGLHADEVIDIPWVYHPLCRPLPAGAWMPRGEAQTWALRS